MVEILSLPGDLVLSCEMANQFLLIFNGVGMKGSKAIHLSRFKSVLVKALEEVNAERQKLVLDKAVLVDPEAEDKKVKVDDKGNAMFPSEAAQMECHKAITKLYEESPVHVDIKNAQLKIAANNVYGILTGDDCPEIGQFGVAHDHIVSELTVALEKKD